MGDTATDGDDAPTVTPAELAGRLRRGESVSILDVRDRDEFERWHIEGSTVEAVQIPHVRFIQASVTGDATDLVADLREPIIVVCGHGEASGEVAAQLHAASVDAANLAGGMDAWARHYEAFELGASEAFDPGTGGSDTDRDAIDQLPTTVRQYDRVASGCLSYLVIAGETAAVVDPLAAFADRYVDDAHEYGADLKYAIDTHVHADHVSGVREVATATGAQPVVPAGATDRGLQFDARLVEDGDSLSLSSVALIARELPGHTSEMTGFALVAGDTGNGDRRDRAPLWLTGDTVFPDAVARPDLEVEAAGDDDRDRPAGSDGAENAAEVRAYARQLYHTIRDRLLTLPDETVLAPGHRQQFRQGPTVVTVGDLRERLGELSLPVDEFVERLVSKMGPQPANFGRIVAANLGRESLTDEAAFEAELGPNNCAVE